MGAGYQIYLQLNLPSISEEILKKWAEIDAFKKDFFVERLTKSIGLKNVKYNAKTIDYLTFKRTNPLFHEKAIAVSKTMRKGLQEEFYIETTHHFILFNWYTTG